MMKNFTFAAISVCLLLFAVVGVLKFKRQVSTGHSTPSPLPTNSNAMPQVIGNGQVQGEYLEGSILTHPNLPFSFVMPQGLYIVNLPDGDENTTLFLQSASGTAMQMVLEPYSSNKELTPEIIRQDESDLEMLNIAKWEVGGKPAVYFESHVPDGWSTLNVWFAFNSQIYKLNAYIEYKTKLKELIDSWQWVEPEMK